MLVPEVKEGGVPVLFYYNVEKRKREWNKKERNLQALGTYQPLGATVRLGHKDTRERNVPNL